MGKQYETVIGLEVHVELNTASKIFCGCSAEFGAPPNTHTCPVCTGMPGALPVLNQKVVEYALKLADALSCRINSCCRFDRKNYFYPDNPQNYQISQLYLPIGQDGFLEIRTGEQSRKIGIREMHMEEDAGKLIHDEWEDCSLVDYNRSGVPLIEIVSQPDMRTAEEVIAFLEKLRMICQYLGISDCKLQEGSMRADVNLSVREAGSTVLGTRTEMKNLNSFKAIGRAIQGERERQTELLQQGKEVVQETRRWDDNKEYSYSMRSKEDAKDYRYFPEPDLPPVQICEEWIRKIRGQRPEFREERTARYQRELGITAYEAQMLTQSKALADLYEETARLSGYPRETAGWLMGEGMKLMKDRGVEPDSLIMTPRHLAALVRAVQEGTITRHDGRKVFEKIFSSDVDPVTYMEEQGMTVITDLHTVEAVVESVMKENPRTVEEYRQGKTKVLGFLMGQALRQMKGQADPGQVKQLLLDRL